MRDLTPRELVAELDRYIVGQDEAKRAVAVAVRNRWRRKRLTDEMQHEVAPKNILMMGPTGVGKTEIARRLAKLTGAPFIKIEASKFTEVGYYGRDVESMIRELVDNAIGLVRATERTHVEEAARQKVEDRLVDALVPAPASYTVGQDTDDPERHERTREKMRKMLRDGKLEDRKVEISIEKKQSPMIFSNMGAEQIELPDMFDKLLSRQTIQRELEIRDARKVLFDQECDALIDQDKVHTEAIKLAENMGIIFLDEIDKICAVEGSGWSRGPDVSRQGVQRDLLPIVEGTTVQTKHGYVKTDHILFVAAGAFHSTKPADLMPELQGRFPIRVELADLTKADFVRILTEPANSLTRQYAALMETEGVELSFDASGVDTLAEYAFQVNQTTQNIGARRLYTILERLLEELSFEAPDMKMGRVVVNDSYVRQRLKDVAEDEDLSRFIL